jgi:hypothetical protein
MLCIPQGEKAERALRAEGGPVKYALHFTGERGRSGVGFEQCSFLMNIVHFHGRQSSSGFRGARRFF